MLRKGSVNQMLTPTQLHGLLHSHFGELCWWPHDVSYHKERGSDARFEIMIGAILTQNTAWSNVEKALENLKSENLLEVRLLCQVNLDTLSKAIRPSGYYNQKAARLKELSSYLVDNYDGDLDLFFCKETMELRAELLNLKGIGPETADSILLYAGGHPVFVVDAYTKRLCKRLPLNVKHPDDYCSVQAFFESDLRETYHTKEEQVLAYNSLHAEIVELAKQFCTSRKPHCKQCPLSSFCMKIVH